MKNNYELIINLNRTEKEIYEKYFQSAGYEIVVSEENLIFAKKKNELKLNYKNENEIINYAINMIKKQKVQGILYINLDQEMNSILEKFGNLDKLEFKENFISWRLRQAITKATLKRAKQKEKIHNKKEIK